MHADLSGLEVDLLVIPSHCAELEVDNATRPERLNQCSGLCIQLNQSITGRHIHNSLITSTIRPIRNATSRKLPRR